MAARERCLRSWPMRLMAGLLALQMVVFLPVPVFALPSGASVQQGDVTIRQFGNRMWVRQGSNSAIVNYSSFSIAGDETVRFIQPGSSAAILNRVTGGSQSVIAGSLLANGQVYLINPNGILFTSSASVSVGGLVASALNMSNADFLRRQLNFSGGGGSVVNEGSISAGSSAILVGGDVENRGSISAGRVILAAGMESVVIDRALDGQIRVVVDGNPDLAEQARAAFDEAGNGEGASGDAQETSDQAEAELADQVPDGPLGRVLNYGSIDASGDEGGEITLHGYRVGQYGTAQADGTIGSGGNITLYGEETVYVNQDSLTTANAGRRGSGGSINLIGEVALLVESHADMQNRGGTISGDGGFTELSGWLAMEIGALPDSSAVNGAPGELLIDPSNFVIDDRDDVDCGGFLNLDCDVTFDFNDGLSPIPALVSKVGGEARINIDRLEDLLDEHSVMTIRTRDMGGSGDGDIILDSSLNFTLSGGNGFPSGRGVLVFDAHDDVIINSSISGSGSMDIIFLAQDIVDINASVNSGGGDIIFAGDGGIRIDASVTAGTVGNVTFASTGSGADIIVNSTVTGRQVFMAADDLVDLNATVTSSRGVSIGGGRVTLDSTINAGRSVGILAENTSVDMSSGARINAGSGWDIAIKGETSADITGLSAPNGNVIVAANDITDAGDGVVDISASRALLYAVDGGVGEANFIETTVGTLEGLAADGDFRVRETDSVVIEGTVAPINLRFANYQNPEEYTVPTPADPADIQVVITNIGGVFATGTGNIEIETINGTITVNGPVGSTGTGDVELDANGGSSDVNVNNAVAANIGDVIITAPDRIAINDLAIAVTNSGNILLSTTSGDIIMQDDTIVANNNGNIRLSAGDDLTTAFLVGDGGDISLLAADNITVRSNVINAGTGDIDIEAFGGTFTMVDQSIVASDRGNVRVAANGNVNIAGILATQGNVRVQSATGSILDNGDDFPADVIAQNASFSAPNGGVGTAADGLEMGVITVAAEAGAGGINLANAGNYTIGTVSSYNNARVQANGTTANVLVPSLSGYSASGGGDILATSLGDVTVAQPVTATGGGNILIATITGEVQGVTQTANVTLNALVSSDGGTITVGAGDNVTQSAGGDITSGGGDISVVGLRGNLTMANGALATSSGGTIFYSAASNVVVGGLNAGAGLVGIIAGDGSILDGGDTHVDVVSAGAQLLSTNGSVGTVLNGIETDIGVVAGLSGNGEFKVNEVAGDLEVGSVGPVVFDIVGADGTTSSTNIPVFRGVISATNGSIILTTASGSILVQDRLLSAGDGNVVLDTGGAGSDITVDNLVFAENGNISLLAVDSITQNSNVIQLGTGDIDFEAPGGSITMVDGSVTATEGGNIRYAADGNIELGTLSATNPAVGGAIRVQSANGSILDAGEAIPVDLAAANHASLSAPNGSIGTLGSGTDDPIEILVPLVAAEADGGGINLASAGDVTIGAVPAITVQQVTTIDTLVPVASPALSGHTTSGGGSIVHVGAGAITVDEAVSADTTGNILLANVTGVVNDITINAPISSGSGNISLVSGDRILQNVGGDISTVGGDIAALSKEGPIVMEDGVQTLSGGGNILYVGESNVVVASLNAGTGRVAGVAIHGEVLDGGDTHLDIIASEVQLTAPSGSGGVGRETNGLETAVDVVAGFAGNGDFKITDVDDLTIGTVPEITVQVVNQDATTSPTNTPELRGIIITNGASPSHILVDTVTGRVDIIDAVINAGRGNIMVAANGDGSGLLIENLVYAEKGSISLLAQDEILQNSNVISAAVGSLDVYTPFHNIIMADGTIGYAEEGPVRYFAEWDVVVSSLLSMSDPVTVMASHGSILDAGDSLQEVLAREVRLMAGGSVGTEDDPLETLIGFISARSGGGGGIHVVNDGIMVVDTIPETITDRVQPDGSTMDIVDAAISDVVTYNSGDIELRTVDGNIIVSDGLAPMNENAVRANGSGSIVLEANGVEANIITTSGITSDSGHICLLADNSVIFGPGTSFIATGGDGTISVIADDDDDGVGDVLQLFGTILTKDGDIIISGVNVRQLLQGRIASETGSIGIVADKAIQISGKGIETGEGDIILVAGSLQIDAMLEAARVGLRAKLGSITGEGGVTAEEILLRARVDIGSSDDHFDIDAGKLAATTDTGDMYLDEDDDVVVGKVGPLFMVPGVTACADHIPTIFIGAESGVHSADFLDFQAGGDVSGNVIAAGGNAEVDVYGSVRGLDTLQAGGYIDLYTAGTYTGRRILAGGDIDGLIGSRLDVELIEGNHVEFTAGSVDMGRVIGHSDVEFFVHNDIYNDSSLITSPDVTLVAGGNIGADAPIVLDTDKIDQLRAGGNIDIVELNGGDTPVNLISAGGNIQMVIPNGGLVDRNGDALNIEAASATFDAQYLGEPDDALEVFIAPGNLRVNGAGLTEEDTPVEYVFVNLSGTINSVDGEKILYIGGDVPPGLIIYNGELVGGSDRVLRRVRQARGFMGALNKMAYPMGILGSPYFVDMETPGQQPWEVFIQYILRDQARVTGDSELPLQQTGILEIGPSAKAY